MEGYNLGRDIGFLEARVKHLEQELADLKAGAQNTARVACSVDSGRPVSEEDRRQLRELWGAAQGIHGQMQTILRKYFGAEAMIRSLHTESLHTTKALNTGNAFTVRVAVEKDARPIGCYADPPGECSICGVAED